MVYISGAKGTFLERESEPGKAKQGWGCSDRIGTGIGNDRAHSVFFTMGSLLPAAPYNI